ncbi:MAG: c-type cytochrome, partial [Planctomycetota bacterium]
ARWELRRLGASALAGVRHRHSRQHSERRQPHRGAEHRGGLEERTACRVVGCVSGVHGESTVERAGRLASATPEEKLAEVRRLNNDWRAASGDRQRGNLLFDEHCASCHKLFGHGKEVGPELTSANRQDRDFLLVSIVDPSSVIRREYVSTSIRTQDGRIMTGLVREAGNGKVLVHLARGEPVELSLDEIDEMKESDVSVMPEDLYRTWSPQALRDLFAYLQSDAALPQ